VVNNVEVSLNEHFRASYSQAFNSEIWFCSDLLQQARGTFHESDSHNMVSDQQSKKLPIAQFTPCITCTTIAFSTTVTGL
jgi:hypothetical protein